MKPCGGGWGGSMIETRQRYIPDDDTKTDKPSSSNIVLWIISIVGLISALIEIYEFVK